MDNAVTQNCDAFLDLDDNSDLATPHTEQVSALQILNYIHNIFSIIIDNYSQFRKSYCRRARDY